MGGEIATSGIFHAFLEVMDVSLAKLTGNLIMGMLPRFCSSVLVVAAGILVGSLVEPCARAQTMHVPTIMPTSVGEAVGMSTALLNRIDEVMQEHVQAGHVQGAVTIVARRGKVVHFSTHGDMDVNRGRAMEPDAIFRMASSTKPVIGVAAMMVVEDGLIDLQDPVSKYIPAFADMKVAAAQSSASEQNDKSNHRLVPLDRPITIHHLLTHTSGLLSGGAGTVVAKIGPTKDDTLESFVAKLGRVPLDFQPGTRWAYGNAGIHAVVPRIIEVVTKMPFHDFVRQRLLDPVGMNHSYFQLPSELESNRVVVLFKGKPVNKKGPRWQTGLSSTAQDFLHFHQMLLDGGTFQGKHILAPESVARMSGNQVGALFAEGSKGKPGTGFGYTVSITLDPDKASDHRGKGAFGWGGAGGTMSWTDPEHELVAVLMLQQPHRGTQEDFERALYQALDP